LALLSLLIQYNIKNLMDEVFVPLEFYTSWKKEHLRYSLFGNVIDTRRRRLHLLCCETLKLCTVHLCWEATVHCVQRYEKVQIKTAKLLSFLSLWCWNQLTLQSHHIWLLQLHLSDPSAVYTHFLKNCNCLCHVILLINFYHFVNIKFYVQAFYILHYLYILACNGWDQTQNTGLSRPPFLVLSLGLFTAIHIQLKLVGLFFLQIMLYWLIATFLCSYRVVSGTFIFVVVIDPDLTEQCWYLYRFGPQNHLE